jgi:hypothetical protein
MPSTAITIMSIEAMHAFMRIMGMMGYLMSVCVHVHDGAMHVFFTFHSFCNFFCWENYQK